MAGWIRRRLTVRPSIRFGVSHKRPQRAANVPVGFQQNQSEDSRIDYTDILCHSDVDHKHDVRTHRTEVEKIGRTYWKQ